MRAPIVLWNVCSLPTVDRRDWLIAKLLGSVHARCRILHRAAADDDRVRGTHRDPASAPQVPLVDSRTAHRQHRDRSAHWSALHRPQPGRPRRRRNGSADVLCRSDAFAGIACRARQWRYTHRTSRKLASPAVLLKNALGFTLAVGSIPASTAASRWLSLAIVTGGSAQRWPSGFFLPLHRVLETWETRSAQRWWASLWGPAWPSWRSFRWRLRIRTMTLPRRPLIDRARDSWTIRKIGCVNLAAGLDRPRAAVPVLAVLSSIGTSPLLGTEMKAFRSVIFCFFSLIESEREDQRSENPGPGRRPSDGDGPDDSDDHLETRSYSNESGPTATDGHHIASGWVARIPAHRAASESRPSGHAVIATPATSFAPPDRCGWRTNAAHLLRPRSRGSTGPGGRLH